METAAETRDALVRRSLLAVSPLDGRALSDAAASGADAIVLDLARGPAAHRRDEARASLAAAIESLAGSGAELLLWTDAGGVEADLRGCDGVGVSGVLVTAASTDDVAAVDTVLSDWEAGRSTPSGALTAEVVLASAAAVHGCVDIASASRRVVAVALDEQSLLRYSGMGSAGRRDLAGYCRGAVVIAARTAGVQAHGSVAAGAGALAAGYANSGRRTGLRGAICFDADTVSLINAGFSPSAAEVESARRALAAMEAAVAEGRGAIAASPGTMADLANVRQAQAVVDRAEAIHRRQTTAEEGSAPPWR